MNTSHSLQAHTQALCKTYLDELPDTMHHIEAAWQQFREEGNLEALQQLQQLAHKLAGVSLTLGYNQIGLASHALETSLKEAASQGGLAQRMKNVLVNLLEQYLSALREAVDAEQHTQSSGNPPATPMALQSLQSMRATQLIYLVEDDPVQAQELTSQIGYFGYTVQTFTHLSDIHAALQNMKPAAILMDIAFPEGDMAGTEAVLALRQTLTASLPVIFISAHDDLPARLQAVRAGGEAYFTKPVNIGRLIDVLDQLLGNSDQPPYRILIIDDVLVQANITAMHLKKAGMHTAIVTDPLHVLEKLPEFNPELILLDIYMPYCTGMELARVIRQQEAFLSIPIVYLSAETDRDKQLEAVGLGGDDFLTKPIKPNYLVAAVTSRVERYRQLRTLMVRDSLTGVLNHTTSKERLEQELARAEREGIPLSFAMLDLDQFKRVNDTYGHTAGDRVLRSLAQLLIKRLRSSDIVGRYGGEEFCVTLPNTTGLMGANVFAGLITSFAKVVHRTSTAEFSATFSCGIAAYPQFTTAGSIIEAADRALYAAKRQGRNRVVLAEDQV